MAKKAVLIGCNYPGTKAELRGCINDVWRMHKCLISLFGFLEEDITVLIDTDHSYTQPTGNNIRTALSSLVRSAQPGDILFVHYSGHGTRLPDQEDDDTGYDECIVPADMNLITDDDFRKIVDMAPSDCRITIVSDSCHSGGLIEATKEQIGDSTKEGGQISSNTFGFNFLHRTSVEEKDTIESRTGIHNYVKNRSLPLATLIDILKEKTGKDDIDVEKLRPTLFTMFKQDATPKVKKFMKHAFDKLTRGGSEGRRGLGGILGFVGDSVNEFLSQMVDELYDDEETCTQPCKQQEAYDGCGILLSGCQTDQTSADACPSGDPKEAYGAFSNVIQTIIEETDGAITNGELVLMARRKLWWQGYTQKPGLYCSDQHVDTPFLG